MTPPTHKPKPRLYGWDAVYGEGANGIPRGVLVSGGGALKEVGFPATSKTGLIARPAARPSVSRLLNSLLKQQEVVGE